MRTLLSLAIGTAIALGVGLSSAESALASSTLYGVSKDDADLRVLDPATGAVLDQSVLLTLNGSSIQGMIGLSRNPIDGGLYGMVRMGQDRILVRVNVETGELTMIGNPGLAVASLAFDASGTLFAVTGERPPDPETLFTLSLQDATPTLVLPLGDGSDGEALGFNPDDGFLYHASGISVAGVDERVFQRIDLDTLTVTDIPTTGHPFNEIIAMVYDPEAGAFLLGDLEQSFGTLTTNGVGALRGQAANLKGYAIVPEPEDADGDGIPDAEDACPKDAQNDEDGDGTCGNVVIFYSPTRKIYVDGFYASNEDIIRFEESSNSHSKFFDGSDVGLTYADIDAFHLLPDGTILMSFKRTEWVHGVGWVKDEDVVRFLPTSLGIRTRGSFEMYFNASRQGFGGRSRDMDGLFVLE